VARESLGIIGTGLALGLLGAVALGQSIRSLLYEVKPMDPAVIASVCAVLAVVGVLACLVPAWRATRIHPAIALRQE
jgi:ABC-type antimicrobial peptide transport system permease subunit